MHALLAILNLRHWTLHSRAIRHALMLQSVSLVLWDALYLSGGRIRGHLVTESNSSVAILRNPIA